MRDADNIRAVETLGVDWMGFIFWPHSSRYVSQMPTYLPETCKRVGVFVDATLEEIRDKVTDYRLDIIQLHGSESPAYIRQLRRDCADAKIIKAFNIKTAADLTQAEAYEDTVDYFLFDTKGKSVGGNGEQFDWDVLRHYNGQTPFLLSGGIGPDDAVRIRDFHHPQLAGIDLNSRFETAPALKDIQKLKAFLYEQNQQTVR